MIVIAILGILAAIVIPQFTNDTEEAKLSNLVSNLWTIRAQIQFYKLQHNGKLPTDGGLSFSTAMTGYTTVNGTPGTAGDPNAYGPYLHDIPANPFTNNNIVVRGPVGLGPPDGGDSGWYFDSKTGAFNANDNDEHAAL